MSKGFIDFSIVDAIVWINITSSILLFIVAYLYFVALPRWLFPQRWTGGGLENLISNILYMVAFTELVVPLMVFVKIFSLFSYAAFILLTKFAFLKWYYKISIKSYLEEIKNRLLIALFDFLDHAQEILQRAYKRAKRGLESFFKEITPYLFFKKALIFITFVYLLYLIGERCFLSLANPLSDTSQFFEWVARLNDNILYADNKTAGADFYGLSVFVFILNTLTHIDTVVLFNIYPLLLILFLFLGVYFVLKRFTLSSLLALSTLIVYGVLLASPWGEYIATPITVTSRPEIFQFLFFKFYAIPQHYFLHPELHLENVSMTPYFRYFSGMAYEFSSTLFLINLFYLIKALDTGRSRYLINYTLSLMLVFIFHGGGAISLIVPSILIALHAFISLKLSWSLLKRGILAIFIAAIFGNGWMLSVLKYGIPQDFGAAAPFLDRLFGTKQAMSEIISAGIEEVTISHLTWLHLFLAASALVFFLLARFGKKGFYFSSFLLIPLGYFIVYFSENLGLPKLVHPSRGVEYLFLSISIVIACYIKFFIWLPLKILLKQRARVVFMAFVYLELFLLANFVPQYKDSDRFKLFINGVQYTDIPYFLYQIIKSNRPLTWTVVSYVQEYSKVLGKGYMINVNEFLIQYDPTAKYLTIPTPKVYIFVEDIPNTYRGKDEWYYRWRPDIEARLKEWIAIYSTLHPNKIRLFAKSNLVSVYEIDNSDYMRWLQRQKNVSRSSSF